MTAKKTANRNCLVPNEGAFCPVGSIAIAVDYFNYFRESCEAFCIIAFKRVVAKSRFHKFALSFRLSGEQKAQSCDNAFHENAVYVKSESAILMLFSMLSFLKPTFLS